MGRWTSQLREGLRCPYMEWDRLGMHCTQKYRVLMTTQMVDQVVDRKERKGMAPGSGDKSSVHPESEKTGVHARYRGEKR